MIKDNKWSLESYVDTNIQHASAACPISLFLQWTCNSMHPIIIATDSLADYRSVECLYFTTFNIFLL